MTTYDVFHQQFKALQDYLRCRHTESDTYTASTQWDKLWICSAWWNAAARNNHVPSSQLPNQPITDNQSNCYSTHAQFVIKLCNFMLKSSKKQNRIIALNMQNMA